MKTIVLTIAVLVAVGLFAGCDSKGDKADEHDSGTEHVEALPAGANQFCPVEPEEKVNPSLYVEYKGKRIYVCCKKCLERVKEDPAAWYAKAYGSG